MNCEYFGKCGSCVLYDKSYEEQLNFKLQREKERFSDFTTMDFDIIRSDKKAFRNKLMPNCEFTYSRNHAKTFKTTYGRFSSFI